MFILAILGGFLHVCCFNFMICQHFIVGTNQIMSDCVQIKCLLCVHVFLVKKKNQLISTFNKHVPRLVTMNKGFGMNGNIHPFGRFLFQEILQRQFALQRSRRTNTITKNVVSQHNHVGLIKKRTKRKHCPWKKKGEKKKRDVPYMLRRLYGPCILAYVSASMWKCCVSFHWETTSTSKVVANVSTPLYDVKTNGNGLDTLLNLYSKTWTTKEKYKNIPNGTKMRTMGEEQHRVQRSPKHEHVDQP